MKNVLITIFYADGLHGGVKYTAEIGNFLHSLGYNVFCVGVLTNETTKDFFANNNVTLFNVLEFPIDILPLSNSCSPKITLKRVVLPAPFTPTIPVLSFSPI